MRVCLIVSALLVLAGTTAAGAVDPVTLSVETTSLAVPAEPGGFDWSGFYAGVYGAAGQGGAAGSQFGLGAGIGVNAQLDFVLVGAEVTLQSLSGEGIDTSYGSVLGRSGIVLTDDILLFAVAGYGWDLQGVGGGPLAGGGLEFALTGPVSLRAQYLHSFDGTASMPSNQLTLGAAFHF